MSTVVEVPGPRGSAGRKIMSETQDTPEPSLPTTEAAEPTTATDAIVALMRMPRDKASNRAWARALCRHFGLDEDAVRDVAFPPPKDDNQPGLGRTGCEAGR